MSVSIAIGMEDECAQPPARTGMLPAVPVAWRCTALNSLVHFLMQREITEVGCTLALRQLHVLIVLIGPWPRFYSPGPRVGAQDAALRCGGWLAHRCDDADLQVVKVTVLDELPRPH